MIKPKEYRVLTNFSEANYDRVAYIIAEYDVIVSTRDFSTGRYHIVCGCDGCDYTEMFDRIDQVLGLGKYANGSDEDTIGTDSTDVAACGKLPAMSH